jgi:hypothetical protein
MSVKDDPPAGIALSNTIILSTKTILSSSVEMVANTLSASAHPSPFAIISFTLTCSPGLKTQSPSVSF